LIVWHSEEISKVNFFDKDEVKQTAWFLVRRGDVVCALCSGPLTVHGCYPRHCRDDDGGRHSGWIAQGHCGACHVYPALIPSFIVPNKHYKADVIERAVEGAEAGDNVEALGGFSVDVSTMRRWVRDFKMRAQVAVRCMISELATLRHANMSCIDLQGMTLLRQLSRLLLEYPAQDSGGVIGNVNIILTTHNCGFL